MIKIMQGWDKGVFTLFLGLSLGMFSLLLDPGAAVCPGGPQKDEVNTRGLSSRFVFFPLETAAIKCGWDTAATVLPSGWSVGTYTLVVCPGEALCPGLSPLPGPASTASSGLAVGR